MWDGTEANLEYTSTIHVEVPHIHISDSYYITFSLLVHTYVLMQSFLQQVEKERKKKFDLDLLIVLYDIASASHKWIAIELQSFSKVTLKNNKGENSSLWAKLHTEHLIVHFALKKKWPKSWVYTIHGL